MRHFYAFSLLVPSYQAGLDFYVGVLGFSVIKDHRINAHKRWLVIAPEAECTTNIILAKATEGGTNKRHKYNRPAAGSVFF